MKRTVELLNQMVDCKVIKTYAVFGAVAQMRYTEAVMTMDVDVLISLPRPTPFVILTPIYEFCKEKGYLPEGEAIMVGEWPVQFIPAFDELSANAMINAVEVDFDGIPARVVAPNYLALMALKLGRIKDKLRIEALLEVKATTVDEIESLLLEYNLVNEWNNFKEKYLNEERN